MLPLILTVRIISLLVGNADDPANRPLAKFKLEKPKPASAEKPVASPQESDPFEDDISF